MKVDSEEELLTMSMTPFTFSALYLLSDDHELIRNALY